VLVPSVPVSVPELVDLLVLLSVVSTLEVEPTMV
jgi:hypothetical protein